MAAAPRDVVRNLCALADPAIRRESLRATLAACDAESLAMLLGYLVLHATGEAARVAWIGTVRLMMLPGSPVDPDVEKGARERLLAHPAQAVLAFLGAEPGLRQGMDVTGDPYALEDVALGVRKARARRHSRDALRPLAADPDPSVIRILLGNPMLAETDAVRVASLRPQRAGTFLELLDSERFGVRETVLAAVVLNPWCPVRLGLALLPLLSRPRLAEVAEAASLHVDVRTAALAMEAVRRGVAPGGTP